MMPNDKLLYLTEGQGGIVLTAMMVYAEDEGKSPHLTI